MGWASGSLIMSDIMEIVTEYCSFLGGVGSEKQFYRELIRIFKEEDCDTLDECLGVNPVFDKVLLEDCHD